MTAEILKDATGRKADITFDWEYLLDLGGVHVRMRRRRADAHARRYGLLRGGG